MEAAKRIKSEVDSSKKRLKQKVDEALLHLKEKVPEETEEFLRKTLDTRCALETRLNSFSESHARYQGSADTDQSKETDKLFQLDAEENRALIDESKELHTRLQALLDFVRDKEKKALTRELEEMRLKHEDERLRGAQEARRVHEVATVKYQEDSLKQARELEEKRLQVEQERVKQLADLQTKHETFIQELETSKAKQQNDLANRQQDIEQRHRETEAGLAHELERLKVSGKPEESKCSSFGSGGSRGNTVRLPKLEFPKFYGDVTKWKEFWDSFNSAIHTYDKLSTID